MNASEEDIALRAEARRKKILENAQKRLDRVLCNTDASIRYESNGVNSKSTDSQESVTKNADLRPDNNTVLKPKNTSPVKDTIHNSEEKAVSTNDVSNNLVSARKKPKPHTNESFDPIDNLETLSKEDPTLLPLVGKDKFDFAKHINLLSNKEPPPDRNKNRTLIFISHVQYAVLAVFVRLMLYFKIGWIFGEMILVPFLLTESVQISLGLMNTSQMTQVLVQMMTLCGFSSHVVQCYAKVNTLLLHCINNFGIYLVTFCLVHNFLDEEIEMR